MYGVVSTFDDAELGVAVMTGEVITVRAGEPLPDYWDACLLVGQYESSLDGPDSAWRLEVIAILRERWPGVGRLVVFLPEPAPDVCLDLGELADWYDRVCDVCDVASFWWPEDADPRTLTLSLMTWRDSQRVVHGTPSGASHGGYLREYAASHAIATTSTLPKMVDAVIDKLGPGAHRVGGERDVPLPVWRAESFRRWYSAQSSAGNTLLGARQVWTFSIGHPEGLLLYWALHVRVYILAENRIKANEVVISRPDISALALYRLGVTFDDTVVVLVREFRSPASTPDSFVHDLPSGSSAAEDPLHQAVGETEEETGLTIDARRIRAHGSRQLAGTMSAHHAHLFAAEITSGELEFLRANCLTSHGVGETEQTWTEISTFAEIRDNYLVDWATLGMIAVAVLEGHSQPGLSLP